MTFIKFYNEEEQVGCKEIQDALFKGKKSPGKFNVVAKPGAERDKDIRTYKESPAQRGNEGKEILTAISQTTDHPACKRKAKAMIRSWKTLDNSSAAHVTQGNQAPFQTVSQTWDMLCTKCWLPKHKIQEWKGCR